MKLWVGITIIVVASLSIVFFAPITDIYRGIATMPAIGGLFAALLQLIRDQSAHERKRQLQDQKNLFNLGATSHMANTVFDKHVEFSELYLKEVSKTTNTLTREGPVSEPILDHAKNLVDIRLDYAAWITPEIDDKLIPFEKALRKIGANAHLVTALNNSDSEDARREATEEMHNIFRNIMGFEFDGSMENVTTITEIKNRIRGVLGISDLVKVRSYLVSEAMKVIK